MPTATAAAPIDLHARWFDPARGTNHTHLEWAEGVAKAISRKSGFALGSQEEDDLVQAAHLTLFRCLVGDGDCPAFDTSEVPADGSADGQFRGRAHQNVKFECIREVKRIRAGGTKNPDDKVKSHPLPSFTNEAGEEEVQLPDGRESPDDEPAGNEPAPVVVESAPAPVASWLTCPRCANRSKLRPAEPRECPRCGAALAVRRAA